MERRELQGRSAVVGGAKDLMMLEGEALAGAEPLRPPAEVAFEQVAASPALRPRLGNVQDPIKD